MSVLNPAVLPCRVFQHCLPLSSPGLVLRSAKGRPAPASVLQAAPRWGRTDRHNNLWLKSTLLPPEPGAGSPSGCCHQDCHPTENGSRTRTSKTATSFSTVVKLPFPWLSIYLVGVNFWLFFRVLTKLILMMSGFFFSQCFCEGMVIWSCLLHHFTDILFICVM